MLNLMKNHAEAGVQRDCRQHKRLHELPLPKDVRLVHPQPVQKRMHGILVRAIVLVYEGDSRIGPVEHDERYEQGIADHVQLRWALNALLSKVQTLQTGKPDAVTAESWTGTTTLETARRNFGINISRLQAQAGITA